MSKEWTCGVKYSKLYRSKEWTRLDYTGMSKESYTEARSELESDKWIRISYTGVSIELIQTKLYMSETG